ncbi:MAG: hypothetical protein H8D56_14545 [Planctomycetes bacterium]|nr:hypothetical protein [Planctomycetota bacterium]MBL7143731.1 hypothetical protein [Phycisphaerae bacterium]
MRNYQKQLILLFIACVIAGATWVIIDRRLIPGEYAQLFWFLFAPVSASFVSVSLKSIAELPTVITKTLMGAVAVLGWYCPMALIAMRKIPLSKRHKIFCIVGFILIWILPLLGYIASKSE